MTPLFDKIRFGAGAFGENIAKIKAGAKVDFPWYPYATMSNIEVIWRLVSGQHDYLFNKPKTIADIGGADGSWRFIFQNYSTIVTCMTMDQRT